MKKSLLILTIVLVLVAAVALTACGGGAPLQMKLVAPWDEYQEIATYNVEVDGKSIGSMRVSFRSYIDETYDISLENVPSDKITPSFKKDKFHGYVIDTALTLDDGGYKRSIAITNMQFISLYSYTISDYKDKNPNDDVKTPETLEVEYKYGEKSCEYKAKGKDASGVIDNSGTIKYKQFKQGAYFDNSIYIGLNRTLPLVQAQLSFLTPSFRDGSMSKRLATNTGKVIELAPSGDINIEKFIQPALKKDKTKVSCLESIINSAETMPGAGTPIVYYYSASPYSVSDGITVSNALMKIVEHGVTYTLNDLKLIKLH